MAVEFGNLLLQFRGWVVLVGLNVAFGFQGKLVDECLRPHVFRDLRQDRFFQWYLLDGFVVATGQSGPVKAATAVAVPRVACRGLEQSSQQIIRWTAARFTMVAVFQLRKYRFGLVTRNESLVRISLNYPFGPRPALLSTLVAFPALEFIVYIPDCMPRVGKCVPFHPDKRRIGPG
ncbi:MAG: hypothetical protein ACYC9J_15420 [Sulfuricaulis sp.]